MSKLIGEVPVWSFLNGSTKCVWVANKSYMTWQGEEALRYLWYDDKIEITKISGRKQTINKDFFRMVMLSDTFGAKLTVAAFSDMKCFDSYENLMLYKNLGEVYE